MCDLVILLYKCTFIFLLNLGNTSAVVIQFLLVFGVQQIITLITLSDSIKMSALEPRLKVLFFLEAVSEGYRKWLPPRSLRVEYYTNLKSPFLKVL